MDQRLLLLRSTTDLKGEEGDPTDRNKYHRLPRNLIYLSYTRPDIAYTVSVISKFINNPCTTILDVVFQILRHLKEK